MDRRCQRHQNLLNAPSCVAANAPGDGAMDDTADIPTARDDMTPPVRRRAFTSRCNTAVARERHLILWDCTSGIHSHEWVVDPSVGQQLKCAELSVAEIS